ncbi:MAG: hypothetical protein EYC62_05085 [Alphaproteobacteria bacterium]|nr:MAG: hypothetical protein EYC62_05085 [Alphaproteobacteria bacterium]
MGTDQNTIETKHFRFTSVLEWSGGQTWTCLDRRAGRTIEFETDNKGNIKILSQMCWRPIMPRASEFLFPAIHTSVTPWIAMQIELRHALAPSSVPRMKSIAIPGAHNSNDNEPVPRRLGGRNYTAGGGINANLFSGDPDLSLKQSTRDCSRITSMLLRCLNLGVVFDPNVVIDPINLSEGRDFLTENKGYDAVFVDYICNQHNGVYRLHGPVSKNLPKDAVPYLVSPHHSPNDWSARIQSTGANLVVVYGPSKNEVNLDFIGEIPDAVSIDDPQLYCDVIVKNGYLAQTFGCAPDTPLITGDVLYRAVKSCVENTRR